MEDSSDAPRRVTVVIVNYNSGALLEKCLQCLRSQTLRADEIMVIDNGSTEAIAPELINAFSEATFVFLEKNIGFAAANNLGVKRAIASEWIAFLNPDAFPDPHWLSSLLNVADKNREYAFFGSKMLRADHPELIDGLGDVYHASGMVWRSRYGCRLRASDNVSQEVFSPCAAAALYRKDAFIEAGGFDESYFCYSEDVDLGFRMRLLGYRCLYVSEAIVRHSGSAISGMHSRFYTYHSHRNLVWTYMKDMPLVLFLMYLPQHILLNLFSLLWFSLHGKGSVILSAKLDALRGMGGMLKKRKLIQKKRKKGAWELRKCMAVGLRGLHSRKRSDF